MEEPSGQPTGMRQCPKSEELREFLGWFVLQAQNPGGNSEVTFEGASLLGK